MAEAVSLGRRKSGACRKFHSRIVMTPNKIRPMLDRMLANDDMKFRTGESRNLRRRYMTLKCSLLAHTSQAMHEQGKPW
jgi:hypothetical protein